jgi:predicted nucleic acid-binding protein
VTLVDTSVWVDHFRSSQPALVALLKRGWVVGHPAVTGELACGNLHRRAGTLADLSALPQAVVASNEEAMHLIERSRLHGLGLGWTDLHLLTSALLSECKLWTRDKRLERASQSVGIATGP